jgi:hypothetical protein
MLYSLKYVFTIYLHANVMCPLFIAIKTKGIKMCPRSLCCFSTL